MKILLQKPFLFLFFALTVLWFLPHLAPFDSQVQDPSAVLELPSATHWLGTDSLGRDLFSRCLQGTRISLFLGLLATVLAFIFGLAVGIFSVWVGGGLERFFQRSWDFFSSIPHLILVALFNFLLEPFFSFLPNPYNHLICLVIVISGLQWVGVARLVRVLIHRWQAQPFIEASRALGAGYFELIRRHVLPNAAPSLISYALIQLPHFTLIESVLSFMGFGLQPPMASWGVLIQEGWRSFSSYPHLIFGPSLFLFCSILILNYFGEIFRKHADVIR